MVGRKYLDTRSRLDDDFGAQDVRPEGNRGPNCQARYCTLASDFWRRPGTWPAERNRKRTCHSRHGRGRGKVSTVEGCRERPCLCSARQAHLGSPWSDSWERTHWASAGTITEPCELCV